MARSKNKRKNGKVIKPNDANIKRMRRMASYDLKDLMICNVVDLKELVGDRQTLIPRSLVYNRKKGAIVGVTPLQERALKSERWKWNIHSGIICRKQDGEVYLDREENIFTQTEVRLTEMNDYVTDTLSDHFLKCNPMHRLTMFWVATPYDMGDVPVEAVLAPVWKFNVLGNLLTQYEMEYPDHVAVHYSAKSLAEFVNWFISQREYQQRLGQHCTVSFHFEKTDIKMKKGELIAFREELQKIISDFHRNATVRDFINGTFEYRMSGIEQSKIVAKLAKTPNCLACVLTIKYDNEKPTKIRFTGGKEEYLT